MIRFKILAAALLLASTAPAAAELPDLGGRTIKAVTENAYVPLNFADPKTGEGIGWEYDAVNEICRRLNCVVDWQATAWDIAGLLHDCFLRNQLRWASAGRYRPASDTIRQPRLRLVPEAHIHTC